MFIHCLFVCCMSGVGLILGGATMLVVMHVVMLVVMSIDHAPWSSAS
jgi:hypothetical protein